MGIAYGVTTNFQATKGIVQDGLILNVDTMSDQNSNTLFKDFSGSSRTVNIGNVSNFTKTAEGLILDLDGTNQNVQIIDSSDNLKFESSAYSVGVWVKIESGAVNQGNLLRIIGKRSHSNADVGPYWSIQMYANGTGGVIPQMRSNGANESTSTYTYGEWAYITSTNSSGNGGTTKLYNGSSQIATATTSQTAAYGYTANYPVILGTVYQWNSGKSYAIGPVHIYNRVLSANEVAQNFNVMRHRFGI